MNNFFKSGILGFCLLFLIQTSHGQDWTNVLSARWVGTNNTEMNFRAYVKDANGNQYCYYESANPAANSIKIGNDTLSADKALVKLSPQNEVLWSLNLEAAAASFQISALSLDGDGNLYAAGVAGPGSFKDTTISGNDVLANKALFIPSADGNSDTLRLRKRPGNLKGYANSPFLLKFNPAGKLLRHFLTVGGQNADKTYSLFLKADSVYFIYKSHDIQGIAKLNRNDFSLFYDKAIQNQWQNATFFGKFAWVAGTNRLFTTLPMAGNITWGNTTLSGASQGYIVEIDPSTGNIKPNYKKLNAPGFSRFRERNTTNTVPPELHSLGGQSLYFCFNALKDSAAGSSLVVDGQTIAKEVAPAGIPLYVVARLELENDTLRFAKLSKIEAQSTTVSKLEFVSSSTNAGDLYTSVFAFKNNSGNDSGIKFTGGSGIVGTGVKAKLLKTNASDGAMSYLGGSTGGANVPTNPLMYIDDSSQVYLGGRYYGGLSFGPFTLTGTQGSFMVRFSETVTATLPAISSAEVSIYPNPSKGLVNLTLPVKSEVQVLDFTGRELRFIRATETETIQMDLPKGIYLVRVKSGNSAAVRKIIVE